MGPDDVPGEILKLGREAMIPYLAQLLDISTLLFQVTGKEPQWFIFTMGEIEPYHKVETRQLNLSVLQANGTHRNRIPTRQVWDKNKWLYKGQNRFKPGYTCKSQIVSLPEHS